MKYLGAYQLPSSAKVDGVAALRPGVAVAVIVTGGVSSQNDSMSFDLRNTSGVEVGVGVAGLRGIPPVASRVPWKDSGVGVGLPGLAAGSQNSQFSNLQSFASSQISSMFR